MTSQQADQPDKTRYLLVMISALAVFVLLLLYATANGSDTPVDMRISSWLQSTRKPLLDQIMVLITMLGDQVLIITLLTTLVAVLACHERWWLSLHLGCVYLCASVAVPMIKVLTDRSRPVFQDIELVSFSFPSGHTVSAALLAGFFALIISQGKGRVVSLIAWSIAGIVSCLVALSRVYLSAHWPSDVLAGLALTMLLLTAFAWQLKTQPPIVWRIKRHFLIAGLIILISGYWFFAFAGEALRYGVATHFVF